MFLMTWQAPSINSYRAWKSARAAAAASSSNWRSAFR
jgi:hypothetical protein